MITPKVWGYEFEIANINEGPYDYCAKKMFLKEQYRCSVHHHKKKDEVLMVGNEDGLVYFEVGSDPDDLSGTFMKYNDRVRLRPGTWHRFSGLRDSWIYEASSHHEDSDSYRHVQSGKIDPGEFNGLLEMYVKQDDGDRILTVDGARAVADLLHKDRRLVGMCNGCFDLAHLGHLSLLHAARERCEVLFVGVNSDESVRRRKGDDRPYVDERGRIGMVAGTRYADYVVICDEDTCLDMVEAVRPDVYVTTEECKDISPEAKAVAASGGAVEVVGMIKGYNTTELAKKITARK